MTETQLLPTHFMRQKRQSFISTIKPFSLISVSLRGYPNFVRRRSLIQVIPFKMSGLVGYLCILKEVKKEPAVT